MQNRMENVNSENLETQKKLENDFSNSSRKQSYIISALAVLMALLLYMATINKYRELGIELQDYKEQLNQCISNK